eukprot:g1026.t1
MSSSDQLTRWEEDRFKGKTENYWYTQTKESICVRIPILRNGARAKDFEIVVKSGGFEVYDKRTDAENSALCAGTFPRRFEGAGKSKGEPLHVRKDETMWTFADGVLTIDLEKAEAGYWHSLFEGEVKE